MKIYFSIIFLFLAVFLTEIATDIYIPSLSILSEHFSTSSETVQKTIGFHLLGFVLGQPLFGILSDKIGRMKALCLGLGLFFATSFGCAFSRTVDGLIFARFLQGIGASPGPVIALAMIKDMSVNRKNNIQLISLLMMVISISPIIGPVIGTLILEFFDWRMNFYLIATAALILFLYSLIDPLNKQPMLRSRPFRESQSDSRFIIPQFSFAFIKYLIMNATLVSCVWVFITEAPFIFMQKFKLSAPQFALSLTIAVSFYILGGWFVNRKILQIDAEKLLEKGLFAIVISATLFILFWQFNWMNPISFLFAICIFEFGLGVARPPIIDKILALQRSNYGTVSALIGISEMLVSSFFIILGSYSEHDSVGSVIYLFTFAGIGSILIQYLGKRKQKSLS